MAKEVKRNGWSRFCRRFNSSNLYRPARLTVRDGAEHGASITVEPFMGISLTKKGRFIDGIEFLSARWNPENVTAPAYKLNDPARIMLEKDNQGNDRKIVITTKDGTEVKMELFGTQESDKARALVERIAYAMYEQRGYANGNDMGDWFEAEHKVKQLESTLTE